MSFRTLSGLTIGNTYKMKKQKTERLRFKWFAREVLMWQITGLTLFYATLLTPTWGTIMGNGIGVATLLPLFWLYAGRAALQSRIVMSRIALGWRKTIRAVGEIRAASVYENIKMPHPIMLSLSCGNLRSVFRPTLWWVSKAVIRHEKRLVARGFKGSVAELMRKGPPE